MQLLLAAVLCNILVLRPLHEEYFLKFGLFCVGIFMFICSLFSCYFVLLVDHRHIHRGVFTTDPPPLIPLDNLRGPKYQNKNWPRSGPEQLFHENSNLREPLAGSMAYFHFGTEYGGLGKFKKHPVLVQGGISSLLADNHLAYSWRKCFWLST